MKVVKVGYGYKVTVRKHEMHVGEYGVVMSCTADEKSATYCAMRKAATKFMNKR